VHCGRFRQVECAIRTRAGALRVWSRAPPIVNGQSRMIGLEASVTQKEKIVSRSCQAPLDARIGSAFEQ